jgi:hypothetical protein
VGSVIDVEMWSLKILLSYSKVKLHYFAEKSACRVFRHMLINKTVDYGVYYSKI